MVTWVQVQANPTFYKPSLEPDEGERLRWHDAADLPHSSQVFCVSAFGMLRQLSVRDRVIGELVGLQPSSPAESSVWRIDLEVERPDLLSEYGRVQPSSVDVLMRSAGVVFCVESKFLRDAQEGFGRCSQPKRNKSDEPKCAGYFGPGSDRKTGTEAWCRLEVWDGGRSPRTYWTLGRAYFRETAFAKQSEGQTCPFNGP